MSRVEVKIEEPQDPHLAQAQRLTDVNTRRMACYEPENATPEKSIEIALQAINDVHRAFGAPGNYGYGCLQGASLHFLYDVTGLLSDALKKLRSGPEDAD